MNGGKKRPSGYTIIEVMIVLAVSGLMFAIAANFISGKQARTSFTVSTHEMNSRVQSIIDQVQNGQFSDVSFGCTIQAGKLSIDSGAGVGQGQHPNCVFFGKFLHVSLGGSSDTKKYEVFTIGGSNGAVNYTSATPITPYTAGASPLELTTFSSTPQGVDVTNVKVTVGVVTQTTWGIGFLQDITASGTGTGRVVLAYVPAPTFTNKEAESTAATAIETNLLIADSAEICMTDGTRYAVIQLGTNGANQTTANLKVLATGTTC